MFNHLIAIAQFHANQPEKATSWFRFGSGAFHMAWMSFVGVAVGGGLALAFLSNENIEPGVGWSFGVIPVLILTALWFRFFVPDRQTIRTLKALRLRNLATSGERHAQELALAALSRAHLETEAR